MSPARAIAAVLVGSAVGFVLVIGIERDALRARYWLHRYRTAPTVAQAREALERAVRIAPPGDAAVDGALRLAPGDVRVTFEEMRYAPAILFAARAKVENISGRRVALVLRNGDDLLEGARCAPEDVFRPLDVTMDPAVCGTAFIALHYPQTVILDPGQTHVLEIAREIEVLKAQTHAGPETRAIELRLSVQVLNCPTSLGTNAYRIEIAP